MTMGDIDTVLAAIDKGVREIMAELRQCFSLTSNTLLYESIEKQVKDKAIQDTIAKMQNELVRFHIKQGMQESQAYQLTHNAKDMADYLNSLDLAPMGWEIKSGPYDKDDIDIRLQIFAVGDRVEAVWAQRAEPNKKEG